MNNYWQVTVQLQHESDKGKVQKVREQYLVEAESATLAEASIYREFDGENNFQVVGVVQSKIIKVL
jgi:hypothetical protein